MYGAATRQPATGGHRALADALVDSGDLDRRAWHRAAAAEEPDESVVAALDDVAERASQRGGLEAASAAWERAAELTVAAGPRASRLLSAAGAAWASAQPGRARALAEAARAAGDDVLLLADVDRLRARIEWNIGSGPVGHRILLQAARDVAGADPSRATVMARMAAAAVTFGADSGIDIDPADFVGDLAATPPGPELSSALLLSGFAHIARGNLGDAAREFRLAFAQDTAGGDVDLVPNLGLAALYIGDDAVALDGVRTVHRPRPRGRRAGHHPVRAGSPRRSGDRHRRLAHCRRQLGRGAGPRARHRSGPSGQPAAGLAHPAGRAARRPGRVRRATSPSSTGRPGPRRRADQRGQPRRHPLGQGRRRSRPADAALHHLEQITHPMVRNMSALDRVEAAARAGRADQVAEWADELATLPTSPRCPGRRPPPLTRARCWPTGRRRWPCSSARSRRTRAPRDGRTGPAHSWRSVSTCAAPVVASTPASTCRPHWRRSRTSARPDGPTRARHELRASGETARRRDSSTPVDLTAQERHVAELVRQGLSNRDAAAQLFLSPRTIDFHLRNVFTKLGVSSRAELAALDLP